MCAIFGWFKPALPASVDRKRLFIHLARKAQSKGESSFGLALVKDGVAKSVRHIGPASTWMEKNKKDIPEIAKSDVLVGHTRQPTKGAVTKANCHPFSIGEWAAAHNGCISNSTALMECALYAPHGETDSEEALCYIISTNWAADAIDRITGSYAFCGAKADGSEAILVCDRVQNLHYVRFGDGVVWSTSGTVLKSSLAAVGLSVEPVKMKSQIIRIPAWTTEPVDESTFTYGGGGNYTGHHAGYTTRTFPQVDVKKHDSNLKCDECQHIYGEHTSTTRHGCMAKVADQRICPCYEFKVKEPGEDTKTPCANSSCKHPLIAHNSSIGCTEAGCPCVLGRGGEITTTSEEPPPSQLGLTDQAGSEDAPEVITEQDLEDLRNQTGGHIPMD